MTDWFSPKDIKFSREQNFWIIQNMEDLKAGLWPPECEGSAVDMPSIRKASRKYAYFEPACQISGELESRLKLTKKDGIILLSEIEGGKDTYKDLRQEAKDALDYISVWDFWGKGTGRPPYYQWLKQRRYYRKNK